MAAKRDHASFLRLMRGGSPCPPPHGGRKRGGYGDPPRTTYVSPLSSENEHGRREFLRGLARYPLLGVLGALGGYLAARSSAAGPIQGGEDCVNRGICRTCRRLAGCRLPHGRMARSRGKPAKPYERTF